MTDPLHPIVTVIISPYISAQGPTVEPADPPPQRSADRHARHVGCADWRGSDCGWRADEAAAA